MTEPTIDIFNVKLAYQNDKIYAVVDGRTKNVAREGQPSKLKPMVLNLPRDVTRLLLVAEKNGEVKRGFNMPVSLAYDRGLET